jgi:hypothetical protein
MCEGSPRPTSLDRSMTLRSLRVLAIALFLPVLGLSCRDATGPDPVRVHLSLGMLMIVNEGERALYSFAVKEEILPFIDWSARVCDGCGLEPRATRFIPVDSIYGGGDGRAVVVFYWRAALGPNDSLVPGPISARRIPLRRGLIF